MKEDTYNNSVYAEVVSKVLQHWEEPRNYPGPKWTGLEWLCYKLATVAKRAAVESAGWYKYRSSRRSGMDGKNWRFVLPDASGVVCVNCHSLLHDDVWTLTHTTHSTNDVNVDCIKYLGETDHWQRVYEWVLAVATSLETHGYDYSNAKEDIRSRAKGSVALSKVKDVLTKHMSPIYERTFGTPAVLPPISVGISAAGLIEGKIAWYDGPRGRRKYGIITVAPEAALDWDYVYDVVKHELIHAYLGDKDLGHGEVFKRFADAVGLPATFQD